MTGLLGKTLSLRTDENAILYAWTQIKCLAFLAAMEGRQGKGKTIEQRTKRNIRHYLKKNVCQIKNRNERKTKVSYEMFRVKKY